MDSRDSKKSLKNPGNSHSNPRSKPGREDMNRNFEVLQYQETPRKAPLYRDKKSRALSPDGQQDPLEAPSKKIKVMGVMEAATTPEETKDKQKITDTVSQIDTYTSLDNGVKQDNIFHNATQHNLDHNKDKFSVENEVSGIKSYRGLRNQGATCYLNAVLQTLFMTKDFRKVIMDLNEESKEKKKSLSFELQKLFKDLESNTKSATKSVITHGVTKALEIGNVCEQQDAAEYYQKILSMIEPTAAKTFQGWKKHSTTCKHGNHDPIEEFISFFSLAIAMDSDQHKINVTERFDAQFEVMLMDGEDQLFCETCKRMMDMEMSFTISELPDVLTLHLQRFYLDFCYMTYMKNNCPVEIPFQLKVQDHHIYDLYALVNHTGSLSGGHYYADIKSFDDQQWYEFNDSAVQRIPKTCDVRHIISDMACLLFYKKSAKQNGHEANAQEEKIVMRSDQSKSVQNNSTSNPEESVIQPHRHTDHISDNSENNHDVTVSIEQDLTIPLNTSDSDTENEAKPSQTETADIEMKPPDADLDHQPSSDASSSAAEANIKSVITSENLLQEIVVSETRNTKPIIDEHPKENNHPSPAERRDLGITRSTFSKGSHTEIPEQCTQRANAWPKDGHKKSLKGEGKTPHNNRTSVQICINLKDTVSLPTDSDTETEANLERQIMNPEPTETAHNESDLDNDEARAQYNSFLQETTVSRRKNLPYCLTGIIGFIGIIVCIILVFLFIFTLIFKL